MTPQSRKLSEILKEMAELLLRNLKSVPRSKAAHLSLMSANIAWNGTVRMIHPRRKYRSSWEVIEADNPEVCSEFKSNDVDGMVDELVESTKQHYAHDPRRILRHT